MPEHLLTVIFDMDGVLVDSEPLYELAFREYLASVGRPDLAGWYPTTLGRRQADFLPELAALLDRPPAAVGAGLDAALGPALARPLSPMPHAHQAVHELASGGRSVGLASSSRRPFVDHVLRTLGLADRFAATATGDEVARGKPDPEIYLLAARRLAAAPQRCVAIEDSPAGVSAARAAGMGTIGVPNAFSSRGPLAHADAVVADLAAAAMVVRGWDRGQPSGSP
jgi:HAD superfamily hydrolase (TIGR01509 family)